MKPVLAFTLSMAVVLSGTLHASSAPQTQADSTASATKKTTRKKAAKAPAGLSVTERLSEMKQLMQGQREQLAALNEQMQSRAQRIDQLQQKLDRNQAATVQAQARVESVALTTAQAKQEITELQGSVTQLSATATTSALAMQTMGKDIRTMVESPTAIHFKGITITPGGFLAAESVYRNRALSADINTPFNSINMPGAAQNAVSEIFGSGRQSRISILAEGKISSAKLSGYYEADFLSAGVTSNNNQSNSYTLRQRQAWGQAAFDNGWTLTGGQMWSLVTETKKGVDSRSEALPMTIDPQYTVGFSWARQFGFRVSKNFNNRLWLAASLENPQTTFAARNNAANFAFGSAGTIGGLYNPLSNYSFNATPDVILKAAFEPGFGHYEVFGILRRFRDRIYPCGEAPIASNCGGQAKTFGEYSDSLNGGGIGANARLTLAKHFDIGAHALLGEGVGRYGTGGLPDATVNPDGTLAPLRNYQGLATIEYHAKTFDLYLNGGEEYTKRRWQYDLNNPTNPLTPVGYGAPTFNVAGCYAPTAPSAGNGFSFGALSNCNADTQSLLEGTVGFWVKAFNGSKGRIQFGPQYSYVVRNAWSGANGTGYSSPHGVENMFLTSFRYYLP